MDNKAKIVVQIIFSTTDLKNPAIKNPLSEISSLPKDLKKSEIQA